MTGQPPVRAHVFVSGRVQGVGYRMNCEDEAQGLGLAGWVRNLDDGRVEAVFEGPRPAVEKMVAWCRKGPPAARVTDIDVQWGEAAGDVHGFRMTY